MGDRLGIRGAVDILLLEPIQNRKYFNVDIVQELSRQQKFAPGEARTHGLQIMRLTRCLLRYGGYVFIQTTLPIHSKVHQKFQSQKFYTHGGTRTPNLRFRRPTPYPLGHAGILIKLSSI